jgi:hypothetical protein
MLGRIAATMSMLTLLAAAPALAWDQHDWEDPNVRWNDNWVDGQLVDVQVKVDGETAPLYYAPGRFDRHYLQAFAGRSYSVVLKNNTGRRVAVLVAVDGLNVVNGEMSNLRSSEPMYVLGPWEQTTIGGWRSSLDEVRKFVFVDERRSYAQRTGQANSDMGWIRVLAFREQLPWWNNGGPTQKFRDDAPAPQSKQEESKDATPPTAQREAPQASGNAVAPEAHDNMARGDEQGFPGTGWGDRREDHVQRVQFTPEGVALSARAPRRRPGVRQGAPPVVSAGVAPPARAAPRRGSGALLGRRSVRSHAPPSGDVGGKAPPRVLLP